MIYSIDNKEHHMAVKMCAGANNVVGYIDSPLSTERYNSENLFVKLENEPLETAQVTKNIIDSWKRKEGEGI